MNLNIVFEDKYIIIVKKPYGVSSQGDKTEDINMIDMINRYIKSNNTMLVHRLDKPVGGIMVFAKGKNNASIISEQIRNKTFNKKYLAVVCGVPKDNDTLSDFMIKNERLNISKVVNKNTPNSKLAQLEYKLINSLDTDKHGKLSLVKINLLTGRHHQIRVQFSNIGAPLWGDKKYNKKIKIIGKSNIALWSYELEFKHPFTNETLNFKLNPDNEYPFSLFESDIKLL